MFENMKMLKFNYRTKITIACAINLLAVSTVFMTQPIFFELSESFSIDITQSRLSFSIVSLFYAISFFFLGPAADKFDLPKIAFTGLLLLSITVCSSSYMLNFKGFLLLMAMTGIAAALIPASMFPYIAKTAPKDRIGIYMGSIVASGTLGVILGRVAMGVLTSFVGWQYSFRLVSFVILILSFLTFLIMVEKNDTQLTKQIKLYELYENSLRLFLNGKIIALVMTGFSLFIGFLGMVTFLTFRLVAPPFHFTSSEVGWLSFAGITALVAPFAGNLSQKTGIYRILVPALLVCLLSLQLMGWFQSILLTTLGLLLLFLSVYTCQPLVFLLIGENAPKEAIGSASSLYILFCIGSGSLASILLGPVWRSYGWDGITLFCTFSLLISLSIIAAIAWNDRDSNGKIP